MQEVQEEEKLLEKDKHEFLKGVKKLRTNAQEMHDELVDLR